MSIYICLVKKSINQRQVSHSGDWVVCSIGNSEIGVDVEQISEKNSFM